MAGKTTIWHPANIFSDDPIAQDDDDDGEYSLIVLNQPMELSASVYSKLWENCTCKVAADGGANRIHDMNVQNQDLLDVDFIIGDLDSLLPSVQKYWEDKGARIIHNPDQYSTDFTKAVKAIWAQSKANLVVLGGLGGRVDQGISVLHHLYTFQKTYDSGKMFLLSSEGITFVLKSGKHKIRAQQEHPVMKLGKNVGIIPLKEPSVITTKGLEWDVTDWETEFGGQISTSNHVVEDWVTVDTTKDVLFTIDIEILSSSST
ncbi:hypothetical protein HYFRA_00004845 [Hymenoscyphus fraxineus]|uniref:Thiamine pyrophosphokinase n=1 Tax=Hymenoscyphus fraxineus TaxID=746836 RepID=A0A9N9PJZ0_9HELO|nr:hypothetical protein HYFRA_00004845 [Hymenoscyphus fraxineus]